MAFTLVRSPARPIPRANELSCRSHPELKIRQPQAQVEPILAILDTPLVDRCLPGAAVPRPRREALPLPLAVLVQWERWICNGSAPEHEILFIRSILLMVWAGLRFADAQRTCPSSLLPNRHVLRESAGELKFPNLASHLVLLPLVFLDDLHAGVGATSTSMRFAIGTPRWQS